MIREGEVICDWCGEPIKINDGEAYTRLLVTEFEGTKMLHRENRGQHFHGHRARPEAQPETCADHSAL